MRPPLVGRPLAILASAALAAATSVRAGDLLPYSIRTRPYSAAETTVRGDIRTVGMAGATTGLADTFIASVDNPSGLAMTDDGGDDTFTSNQIHDGEIQNSNYAMNANFVGFALAPYPWGFGAGYVSLYQEGQPYVIPGASTSVGVPLDVISRELQFAAGRVFFDNRFALGATLRLGQAEEDIDLGSGNPSTAAYHSYSVGATFGGMWQLPHRFLLGASYSTPMRYSVDAESVPPTMLPGFFQPVENPSRASLGLGWIPNRFFRANVSATLIGATANTALLSDQGKTVGINPVWEPRMGAAYIFADFKELRGTFFAGTYYEYTRVSGQPNRLHGTFGIEMKPWIFTVGAGIDDAYEYENDLLSLSVDVFKVLAKLDIIPTAWHPDYTGFQHDPFVGSDRGLARPLVEEWRPRGPDMDPIDIGLQIPQKISQKVGEAQDKIISIVAPSPEQPEETLVDGETTHAVKKPVTKKGAVPPVPKKTRKNKAKPRPKKTAPAPATTPVPDL